MTTREPRPIDAIADELRAEGWSVLTDPSPEALPPPLRTFHPEALAHRSGESRVIAVRRRDDRAEPATGLRRLAEAVNTLPGWTLTIHWVGEELESAPAEVLRERLKEAQLLRPRAPELALLLIWSAVEGAMSTRATALGRGGTRVTGLSLANDLYDWEELEESDLDLLRRAQRLRNQVAHGRKVTERPSEQLLEALVELAERLLAAEATTTPA